jgi:hypothetical protein
MSIILRNMTETAVNSAEILKEEKKFCFESKSLLFTGFKLIFELQN